MAFIQSKLYLGAGKSLIDAAHKYNMVFCTISDKFISSLHEVLSKDNGINFDLCDVVCEFLSLGLFELSCKSGDLMVVWSTLEHWEDTEVDDLCKFLAAEDHAGSWSTERLVGGRGNDIGEFEWVVHLLSSSQSTQVSHIGVKISTNLVANIPESLVI